VIGWEPLEDVASGRTPLEALVAEAGVQRIIIVPGESPDGGRPAPVGGNGDATGRAGKLTPRTDVVEGIGRRQTNPRAMGETGPTVQRTLVKSPPELWADLSNPETLARRLGEFGEIRITRLVPETTVAWEGERASGTVEIEPSGWGTKVRLSARATAPAIEEEMITDDDLERESALTAPDMTEIEREAAIEAALLAEVQREAEIEAALRAEAEAEADAEGERQRRAAAARAAEAAEPVGESEPEPVTTGNAVEPKRGFFARVFRRRPKRAAASPTVSASPSPQAASPQVQADAAEAEADRPAAEQPGTPATPSADTRPVDPDHRPPVRLAALAFAAAKPADQPARVSTTTAEFDKPGAETITASRHPRSKIPAKPALDDEQTLAVLTGVLDDLGAAHHRPFSRENP
jgi:hypothetical protein